MSLETKTQAHPESWVGKALSRGDFRDRVTGEFRFASDFGVDGMLEASILRSPFAHAEILSINASEAMKLPGVVCVLTPEDFSGIDPYFGPTYRDQPILAIGRARFEGEPVAAVAAVDKATAQEAVKRIDVKYRPLPAVDNPLAARSLDAPDIHTEIRRGYHYSRVVENEPLPEKNVGYSWSYQRGDADRALAEADLSVTGEYVVPIIHHYPLEPIHVVARFDRDDVTVWSGTQTPFQVRQELAAIFGLPQSRIRVLAQPMGGAFGAKAFPKLEPLAVALARKAGRPVRIALSMEETARTIRRTGARIRIMTGVNRDGIILARRVELDFQMGAYADAGPRVAQKASYVSPGPYRIPNLAITARAVYTNTPPSGAYRGFGAPQTTWAYELHTDEIAARLGMDPLDFRKKNLLVRGEMYFEGDTPIDTDFAPVLEKVASHVNWGEPLGPWRGRGLAVSFKPSQSPTESTALVRLHSDGSATLLCGTADMGQGTTDAMAQIAAEELGISVKSVRVQIPDTAQTLFDQTTTSSRSTVIMGRAVQNGSRQIREQLLERAARLFKTPADQLKVKNGAVHGPDTTLSIPEVLARTSDIPGSELAAIGHFSTPKGNSSIGGATPFWEPCWAAAEVEVNPNTGLVKILRFWTAVDAGRAVNPQQVEAQDIGSAEGMDVAHHTGRQLAQKLDDGEVVHFLYAPTRRTRQTAHTVREGMEEVLRQRSETGIQLLLPEENWVIRNPDIYVGGKRVEMVSSPDALHEQLTGTGLAVSDLRRVAFFPQFWSADDRIGYRLSHADPPGESGDIVARRFLAFARSLADLPREGPHRFVCVTHSGCIRAVLLNYVLKRDMREPEFCESVDLCISDNGQVGITYQAYSKTLVLYR